MPTLPRPAHGVQIRSAEICPAATHPAAPPPCDLDDLPGIEATGPLAADAFDVTVHDAVITATNPATGRWRTFRVHTVRSERSNLRGKRVVSLLTGPNDYTGFGFADEFGVHVWASKRGPQGQPSAWERYARMLERVREFHDRGVQFRLQSFCRRCGRPLSAGPSLKFGFGPVCWEIENGGMTEDEAGDDGQ